MQVWSFCIAASQIEPDRARGFVRAPTTADALRRVGHPDANVYQCMSDVYLPLGFGPFYEHGGLCPVGN